MQETDLIQEAWDKKKILTTIFSLVTLTAIGFGIKFFIFDSQKELTVRNVPKQEQSFSRTVMGAQSDNQSSSKNSGTSPGFSFPSKTDLEEKLNTFKNEVTNLDVADIASSSPQVQKLLNDLRSLQEYPHSQAKETCLKLCNSF